MKKPLTPSDERLRQTIEGQFDIPIQTLHVIPIRESAELYKATDSNGHLFAVKAQVEENPAVDEVRRLLATHDYEFVPKLHLTKNNEVQAMLDGFYISVEDYIEPSNIKAHDTLPNQTYLFELGRVPHSLHAINIAHTSKRVPAETFHSTYLPLAKESINNFKRWSEDKPEAQKILDILDRKSVSINTLFADSVTLGTKVAAQAMPLVLTYGDVHFGNTIEDTSGKLYLIDWDLAMLARPGHDLMYFSDSQLAAISKGYGMDLLENRNELQYYRDHLMLRYLWFWLNKAMHSSNASVLSSISETIVRTLDDSPYMIRAIGIETAT